MEDGLIVASKPTAAEGKPPMSAEEIKVDLAIIERGLATGFCQGQMSVFYLAALQTAQWAIDALKAAYLAARDGLDDDDDSADMCHWIGADLKALGVDVEKL